MNIIMKRQLLFYSFFLALVLTFNISLAQQKRYDFQEIVPGCACPEFEKSTYGWELKPTDDSTEFEIRFLLNAKWYDQMVTTITRKDGKYVGYFYHKMKDDFRTSTPLSVNPYHYKKFHIDEANLDSIVEQLLAHQITTLPNQREIYKKGFLTPYHIIYKINGSKRSFSFGSPQDPIREYPDEPVYRHYEAILTMFLKMVRPMYSQVRSDISREITLQQEKEKRDTIFLRKPNAEGHSVYVDKDEAKSPYFAVLTNLDYTNSDKQYKQDVKELQKYKKPRIQPITLGELPRNWVQLHTYKERFYVYSPSNRTQRKVSFNDSTMLVKEMERMVHLINGVTQNSKDVYAVSTTDFRGNERKFRVHLVEKSRGIAVFENFFGKGSHALMVTVERANRFPLVVNYSPNHMEPEFVFDTPDFKTLLN